jgi:hypothetical protein
MNVYDIEFTDFTGDKTRSIIAKDMKEAAEIADKMLQISLANLWEDISIEEIRFVCQITEFKEFVSEIEEKGKEIKEQAEEDAKENE